MHRLRPNSFQITTLIVFESSSLLAPDHTHTTFKYLSLPLEVLHLWLRARGEPHMKSTFYRLRFFFFFFLCMIYESSQRRESRQGRLWLSMVGVWASAAFQMSVIRRHRLRHVDYHRLLRNYQPGISMSGECAKIISHNSERTWMALLSIKVSHGGIDRMRKGRERGREREREGDAEAKDEQLPNFLSSEVRHDSWESTSAPEKT